MDPSSTPGQLALTLQAVTRMAVTGWLTTLCDQWQTQMRHTPALGGCPASFAWLVGPALPAWRRPGRYAARVRTAPARHPPCDNGTPSRPPSVGEWRRNSRTNDGQKIKDPTAVDSDQALDLLLR